MEKPNENLGDRVRIIIISSREPEGHPLNELFKDRADLHFCSNTPLYNDAFMDGVIENLNPDLMITSLQLYGSTEFAGFNVIEYYHNHFPDLPIVCSSLYIYDSGEGSRYRERALRLGAVDAFSNLHLPKAEDFLKYVEDSGLFIKELKGFPGTNSSPIHKQIGLKVLLKLMENIKDRECYYKSAVAYCEPNQKAVSFLGEEKGQIATEIKGNNGFGHDPIFIPENSDKTYGEMKNVEEKKQFRRMAVEKLRDYLLNKR